MIARTTHDLQDPRFALLQAKDPASDGRFWYAVVTTGIYCRPSCPSRAPNPRNVRFFAGISDARVAGFRPCRRCNPDGLSPAQENAALVERTCRLIQQAEHPLSLAALAEAVQLTPTYFHRLFKQHTGVTPRDYAAAHRATRARQELRDDATVTEAIHAAGFGSNGRFYEASAAMLGMSPKAYQRGGLGETLHFALGQTTLGTLLAASSAKGIACILLGDDPAALLKDLQDRFPRATLIGGEPAYETTIARIAALAEAPRIALDLPLDIRGTLFQQRVWQALQGIPAGTTVTYTEIAARIGAPKAVRAVAAACAANALAIAIPCHRVVRQDGNLAGYRWGLARKQALLVREKAA